MMICIRRNYRSHTILNLKYLFVTRIQYPEKNNDFDSIKKIFRTNDHNEIHKNVEQLLSSGNLSSSTVSFLCLQYSTKKIKFHIGGGLVMNDSLALLFANTIQECVPQLHDGLETGSAATILQAVDPRQASQEWGGATKLISVVTSLLKTCPKMSSKDISRSLYALRKLTKNVPDINSLADAIASQLASCSDEFDSADLRNSFFGLRHFDSESVSIRRLLAALTIKLKQSKMPMTPRDISMCMHGIQNMSSDNIEVNTLLDALFNKLSNNSGVFDGQCIGNSLLGLQNKTATDSVRRVIGAIAEKLVQSTSKMKAQEISDSVYGVRKIGDTPEVRKLLRVLTDKIYKTKNTEFTGRSIGEFFFGLQELGTHIPEVRDILQAFATKAKQANVVQMSSRDLAMSFYGLKCMHGTFVEVHQVLKLLADLMEHNYRNLVDLDGVGISNIMSGMKNMSSNLPEVRRVISALTQKIRSIPSNQIKSGIDPGRLLTNCLYSLQCMSTDAPEVCALLQTLANIFEDTPQVVMIGRGISNSLYGLHNCHSDVPEVSKILSVLIYTIDNSPDVSLSPQAIGNALFSLQCMSTDTFEVQRLLDVLCGLILRSKGDLTEQDLGMAFYGLINCSLGENWRPILSNWFDRIEMIVQNKSTCSQIHQRSLACNFLLAFFDERKPLYVSIIKLGFQNIIMKITNILSSKPRVVSLSSGRMERYYGALIEKAVQNLNKIENLNKSLQNPVEISFNENLYGFEADVVARYKSHNENHRNNCIFINFEIDGVHHLHHRKQRYCRLRDEYLSKIHRVNVCRIDAMSPWVQSLRDEEFTDAIQKSILSVKTKTQDRPVQCAEENDTTTSFSRELIEYRK